MFSSDYKLDELDDLAVDSTTGKAKHLNNGQLDSIKKYGSFEVESKNFNGQNHKWVLAKWIQKGSVNTTKSFHQVNLKLIEIKKNRI